MRADLPAGLQAAQACHAAFEFSDQHAEDTTAWLRGSNYLIIVSVPDEYELMGLMEQAASKDIYFTAVREPDIGDELTAVAFKPGVAAQKLCASLPLALRERSMV